MTNRKQIVIAAKAVVTASLLWLLLSYIDTDTVGDILRTASWPLLMACGLMVFPLVTFDALRWQAVLRALGYRITFPSAFTYTICSLFFGNLAPAFFGIDAFRAMQMYRQGFGAGASVRTVLTDRVAGFMSLMLVIAAGLPIMAFIVDDIVQIVPFVGVWAAGCLALVCVAFLGVWRRFAPGWFEKPIVAKVTELSVAIQTVLSQGKHTTRILGLGVLVHLTRCTTIFALAMSLGFDIDFWVIFAVVPVSLLMAMVPVTLADWGIREAVFIFSLGLGGMSAEQAFTLSVVFGLYRIWGGVLGGVWWMMAEQKHYSLSDEKTAATAGAGANPPPQTKRHADTDASR